MKKSRFSDSTIIAILKQAEAGSKVPDLCREHSMSDATFYKWRARFQGVKGVRFGFVLAYYKAMNLTPIVLW